MGDPGADLLHLFHIMGSVNNGGALFIQLFDPFQDLIAALWVNGYRWFIHNDQTGLVGNSAGNVETGGAVRRKAFLGAFCGNRQGLQR